MVVRDIQKIPYEIKSNDKAGIIIDNIIESTDNQIVEYLEGCDAVISCLGHNITLDGIFGKPHKLVTDVIKKICYAGMNTKKPLKIILMNTTANRNLDISENYSVGDKIMLSILRRILPPQKDNECAANYLRNEISQKNPVIEWIAVRPDTLINQEEVSDYDLFLSPIRSPVFNSGKTSRINVADIITKLINDSNLWNQWKGKMPVIYNR
jgi:hypothetical protein